MDMKKSLILVALAGGLVAASADDFTAIQLSAAPDVALYPRTTFVCGFALNLWGENPQQALNLGIINGSTGESEGLTWAFLANYADSYRGVMWGLVNVSREKFVGWQDGIVNYSQGTFSGLQTGWFNIAEECHGLQLGGFNYAEHLNGVQIGVINIAMNNGWFDRLPDKFARGFPFFNWSF